MQANSYMRLFYYGFLDSFYKEDCNIGKVYYPVRKTDLHRVTLRENLFSLNFGQETFLA